MNFTFLWDPKNSIMAFLVAAILDLKKTLQSNFKKKKKILLDSSP